MNRKFPWIVLALFVILVVMGIVLEDASLSFACHLGTGGMRVAANLGVFSLKLQLSWLAGGVA
jgi:hypothetical protein